ncbi:MAG: NAD(P)-binding domain-containing protein [Candidatus Aenigmarchaeota archaeon]|nr:NAD(P)-binding domain-containing protein [Candidatus Aenigmarchaeota archaeon]
MVKIAILGCGEIGEQILRNLRESDKDSEIWITRRNSKKGHEIAEKYSAAYNESNVKAIENADVIFLCLRPADMYDVLNEIKPHVEGSQTIISTAASISIEYIKRFFNGPVTRYIPSPLITENGGVAIVSGDGIPGYLKPFMSKWSSKMHVVDENDMELFTILTSSGSAFISTALVNVLDRLPVSDKRLPKELILDVIDATAESLRKKSIDECRDVMKFCSTPDGITAEGIRVLSDEKTKNMLADVVLSSLAKSKNMKKEYEK